MSSDKDVSEVVEQALETLELSGRIYRFHFEPRCRICQNTKVRTRANDLLAQGNTYRHILRVIENEAADLEVAATVGMDSIRTHATQHFPVQSAARAAYRDILERRAAEGQADFVEGTVTAITPMAFFETVMTKGYQHLVKDDTEVGVQTGMAAAAQLQAMLYAQEHNADAQQLAIKLNQIIEAVRAEVPVALWDRIVQRLRQAEQGEQHTDVQDAEFEDEDDEGYDPTLTAERDDDL